MNSKAIYTVIDDDGGYEFATDIAGGFCYPFYILSSGRLTARELGENSIISKVQPHEMLPLMRANYQFPKEFQGEKIFSALSGEQADKLKMDFIEKADIPCHITLDFQKREIGFEFNKNICENELCDIRVSADDKSIAATGYNSYMKHLPPNEANESYRIAVAELCKTEKLKQAPVITAEIFSLKGWSEIPLPMSEQEVDALRVFIGSADVDSYGVRIKSVSHENLECLKELRHPKFSKLNETAKALRDHIGKEDIPFETFAAVMEADEVINVKDALFIARNIDIYKCIPAQDDEEYGHYVLYESDRDDIEMHFAQRVEDYIDFDRFGYDCAEDDGAIKTSKGYVVRDEQKLIQRMSPQIREQAL